MVGFFFLNMEISVYLMHECIHIRYLNISPKTVKNEKKMPKMLIQGLSGALSSGVFFSYCNSNVINMCIHINYLNKEKFAQIKILAQQQSRPVKNDEIMPKMLT